MKSRAIPGLNVSNIVDILSKVAQKWTHFNKLMFESI